MAQCRPDPRPDGRQCNHEWGRAGARDAAARGDIVIIVDTLRFSTAVAAAAERGAWIYPCATPDEAASLRARIGGEIATWRPAPGQFSLSPRSYEAAEPFQRVILPSPNGATCTGLGKEAPYLFAGALVNASVVAATVGRLMDDFGLSATVVSCGERRQGQDVAVSGADPELEAMRPAIEDYLGAGAILAGIDCERSPEAELCVAAFEASKHRLSELLWECESGRELREKGFGEDVRFAAELDRLSSVPELWATEFFRHRPARSLADLLAVASLMESFPHPWWIAGGWALDLLAGEPYREHEDIEIGIDRRHQAALQEHLAGRQLFKAAPTVEGKPWDIVPWAAGERLELPLFQVMVRDPGAHPDEFEFFLNEIEDREWRFRRDPSIRRDMETFILRSPQGLPIICPEAQLLHKAQRVRPKDRRDFERVAPLLLAEQKSWLRSAIAFRFPEHPWLNWSP